MPVAALNPMYSPNVPRLRIPCPAGGGDDGGLYHIWRTEQPKVSELTDFSRSRIPPLVFKWTPMNETQQQTAESEPVELLQLWGYSVPVKRDEEDEDREPIRMHGQIEPSRREGD